MTKLILLIADSGGAEREFKRALKKSSAGCKIECAGTRDEIAALPRPSLIILDLMLSAEPAPELLGWMRNEPRYRDLPVFILGSQAVKDDIAEAYKLGANACFIMESDRERLDPIAEGIVTYASLLPANAFGAC